MKIDSEKVKTLRLSKNWSQEQLSEISNLSLRTIQRIENGSNISLESLKLLAIALRVDPSELMIQEKQKPTTPIEAVKSNRCNFILSAISRSWSSETKRYRSQCLVAIILIGAIWADYCAIYDG